MAVPQHRLSVCLVIPDTLLSSAILRQPFFYSPPRHIQQVKCRDNISVWFFCITYFGFEWLVSSWQFIQLAEKFDSQPAQEQQSIWSCGWSQQVWFSKQQEGQQLLLMALALIVMGNGGSLLNAVSFLLLGDDKLFGKIGWLYQQHWNRVVLEIKPGKQSEQQTVGFMWMLLLGIVLAK